MVMSGYVTVIIEFRFPSLSFFFSFFVWFCILICLGMFIREPFSVSVFMIWARADKEFDMWRDE